MNVFTPRRASFHRLQLASLAITMAAITVPHAARAADAGTGQADSAQTVDCMLPGQIHSVGGQPTMGPRHPERTTAADCRTRGGEYTVDDRASQPAPVAHSSVVIAEDNKVVRCLLPKQERQLGEQARYTLAERTIRITRYNCRQRGGSVINATHGHHASPKK